LKRVGDGTISNKIAKEVFEHMCRKLGLYHPATSTPPPSPQLDPSLVNADQIIEEKGLKQISDSGEIGKIVEQIIAANARSVEEYKAGKEKAFNALVGQVMKATKGKANPAQVNEMLKLKLGG
jgi:aspartyl-tRNA(Asn)/glutamyl-tRNA(Gln) amidotransferase subunit B